MKKLDNVLTMLVADIMRQFFDIDIIVTIGVWKKKVEILSTKCAIGYYFT